METYWSRFAKEFDAKQAFTVGEESIAEVTARLSKLTHLGKVLEFGCGNGRYTKSILHAAESVVATDYSIEMVDEAKRILGADPKITVEQADCHQTAYEAHSFDTIVMANLIHIVANPETVIIESRRLLKPNGMLILTCFTIEGMSIFSKLGLLFRYKKTFGAFPENRTPFTVASLCQLLSDEGFDIEDAELLGKKTRSIFVKAQNSASP